MRAHFRLMIALLAVASAAGAFAPALRKAGDAVEGSISTLAPATHSLPLESGQFLFAQVNGIRMTLELLDPSGRVLGQPGRLVAASVTESGSYLLRVRTMAPAQQRYVLTINQWRPSRPDDTTRLEALRLLNSGYRGAELGTAESRGEAVDVGCF